ncbi:type 1 glutamine amidotransferase domain-containing protein [Kitasatospora sp. HPMI-4]|uniref:type 1 glutamine amidotransferase domain-containing protein n=1 Tax=Kitasatospora sp. HPMI-4 TaxID=3448443 RepID=UPI003F1D3A78
MVTLQGLTVAFLVARQGAEQLELTGPWQAVLEAGGTPRLISTRPGRIQAFRHLDKADTFAVDAVVGEVGAEAYAGLVLPGGVANPDFLRLDPAAVGLVRDFFTRGKPVAAICHAPWLLVEADVVRGRTLTSWPSLRTDLVNAGATWVDEEVRICADGPNTLITSRRPADLPVFEDALVTEFARQRRGR